MMKAFGLLVAVVIASASASVIKNTVLEESYEEPSSGGMVTTTIIRNCGCLLLTSDRATVGHRYLPRSLDRDVICSAFCDHLSASHFATMGDDCLCFDRPADAIDCEEVETSVGVAVAELKCVDRPPAPKPTRRNTVSGSVLTFLRNIPTTGGGDDYRGLEQDLAQFEDEIQRNSRHINLDTAQQLNKVTTVDVQVKEDVLASSKTTSFGPSKSVGLAATLILLAFVCIFTMGLKTWYHTRRKEQKEAEKPSEVAKKDIDWEKIMSY